MRVMGIDPALASIGHALLFWDEAGIVLQEYDTLETPPKTSEGSRLRIIRSWLESYLEVRQPHVVVMERPVFHGALAANSLPLGMAYGVMAETIERACVRLVEYYPRDIKFWAAGNTSAKKPQMRQAISDRLGVPLLKGRDDGIDAIGGALTYILKEQKDRDDVRIVR